MSLVLFLVSLFCFLAILVFGKHMDPLDVQRFLSGGLAAFAAAHLGWPANWGPRS